MSSLSTTSLHAPKFAPSCRPSKIEETQETPDVKDAGGQHSPNGGDTEIVGDNAEKEEDTSDSELFQNNNRR